MGYRSNPQRTHSTKNITKPLGKVSPDQTEKSLKTRERRTSAQNEEETEKTIFGHFLNSKNSVEF